MEDAVKFKKQLLAREYGSNIYNLVQYVVSIEDREKRTEQAKLLKKLIEKMHPHVRYSENADQKVWGDMYVMGDMKLDVDAEFEKPNLESLLKKPDKVAYNRYRPKYKHYGKNIELIMDKLKEVKDEEVKEQAIVGMGKLMKTFYRSWNKESIENELVAKQISHISDGEVTVPKEMIADTEIFESKRVRSSIDSGGGRNNNSNNNKNNNNNNNNNNRNRNRNHNKRKKK